MQYDRLTDSGLFEKKNQMTTFSATGHPINFVHVRPLYFASDTYITVDRYDGRLETYFVRECIASRPMV